MYIIYKKNGRMNSPYHKEFVCYDSADFEELQRRVLSGAELCAPGSVCTVTHSGYYILSTTGAWVQSNAMSGGGESVSDMEFIDAAIECDALPAMTDGDGAILTDEADNIILG